MPARQGFSAVAYNGYLYVMGGISSSVSDDCNPVSTDECYGVFYAPINSNGTIGSWAATSYFDNNMPPRQQLSAVAYNGYLYVMGGIGPGTGDLLHLICNGVFYAPINSNGTIGSWQLPLIFRLVVRRCQLAQTLPPSPMTVTLCLRRS